MYHKQKNPTLPAPDRAGDRGGFRRGAGGVIIYEKNMTQKTLILKGEAVVYIDWANVHGWEGSLKCKIDIAHLFAYLKTYPQTQDIRLYFGKDIHPKSVAFLQRAQEIGYTVTSKDVKYILEAEISGRKVYRRKCDFDMEICIDVHEALAENIRAFVFFTGDGDFAPLYKKLIHLHKQVIVIYSPGHLGREIWDIKKGVFKIQLKNLFDREKSSPRLLEGRD
ncbi:MAG: NYN domain-containing protein [Candidatus Sungbacteria bacterium]|nr:NYN domain-containing protein [Candidatus Sungbacteria bacterium]